MTTSATTGNGVLVSVTGASTQLLAADSTRNYVKITNQSTTATIYLGVGTAAVVGTGTSIAPGANVRVTSAAVVNAISNGATTGVLANCISTMILAANASRTRLTITNDSWVDVCLALGAAAITDFRVAPSGILLPAYGGRFINDTYTGSVYAATDATEGGWNICIQEETQ